MQCPTTNFFRYNSSLCACNPGFLYDAAGNICSPFTVSGADEFSVGSGVDYSINFPQNLFSFDSIKKYTQSQAVFLEATAVMIVVWLVFCFGVRFGNLGDGRTSWYKIRWWISRLDICFATRHWLKVVKKRKTELGGAFSIASCILFVGLFAALLYQIISKRTIEVHSVRASNAPDLASFNNDMVFNITTISSMSCSNLRNLGTLVTGNPGFIDFRSLPLSNFANFSCQNTTKGPKISLKCDNCRLFRDDLYISWQFVDLPNAPASAVGFEFNLTSRDHRHKKHLSFVNGILKNGSTSSSKFVTYRGRDPNILQFNLFPRIYRNKHNLKLIQPLFHEFLPGSSFDETNRLRDALERPVDGLVNTTLHVNFLSDYIVEVNTQNIMGPVGFLADLGGLYCISIGLFFYFLVQFEYRFKRFRNEDSVMRRIRSRRKAREYWDKLRKYVNFTWGRGSLPREEGNLMGKTCCGGFMIESLPKEGSSTKRRQHLKKDTISFNSKAINPSEKVIQKEGSKNVICDNEKKETFRYFNGDAPRQPVMTAAAIPDDDEIPLPPSLEIEPGSEISVLEIQKNLENLYEYNIMLREKLIVAQSKLHNLTSKASSSSSEQKQQ